MAEREDLVALIDDPASFLDHGDPDLRRMATTALGVESINERFDTVADLLKDENPAVRAAAAEKLGGCGNRAFEHLVTAQTDDEPKVREAIATAFGELANPSAINWLVEVGTNDPDRTVKEAAVAALGAIGDDAAIDPLLGFISSGPPQTRRRAIAAITVFEDPRIEAALTRAALDRNPGVREAAEMIVGRQLMEDERRTMNDGR